MLFYNENDEICFKDGENFKVLYERDRFELNGKWYTYSNDYFYETLKFEEDYEVNWEKRKNQRHMNILEMEEAFAPPSYKSDLDFVFDYKVGISEDLSVDEYCVMYNIERKINEATYRSKETAYIEIKGYELEQLKEKGVKKILDLVNEDYKFEYYSEKNSQNEDEVHLIFFL